MSVLLLPKHLLKQHRHVRLKQLTLVESCLYAEDLQDEAFLQQHELIYLFEGQLRLHLGPETVHLNAGEAVLLPHQRSLKFRKTRSEKGAYRSLLFFLRPEFVADFLLHYPYKGSGPPGDEELSPFHKLPPDDLLANS